MSRRIGVAAALFLCLGISLGAREPKDSGRESYLLLRRALAVMDLSDLADAAKAASARNDAFGEWLALVNLAWTESALGRPKEAIASVQKAFTVLDEASHSTAPFNVETFLAFASDLGVPRETSGAIESNADAFKPLLLQYYLRPFTHDLYGSLLTESGDLEKAEEELNRAAAGVKNLGGRYDYSIASHFGDLRFRQQRHDEARAQYQKALNGFSKSMLIALGDPQLIEARVYDRLARIEAVTGNPEAAKRWSDAGRQAASEARIGGLHLTNRRYGPAAAHLERSLELYRSLNDPSAETRVWGDLCLVYIQSGNYAAAETVLTRARERVAGKSELGDDMLAFVQTTLRFYRGQASALELEASVDRYIRHVPAEHDKAASDVRRMLDYAATAFKTGDFSRHEVPSFGATMRLAEGAQQLQKGNAARARTIWRDALEKHPGDTARASLLLMMGLSYFVEGNMEQASRWLAEGTALQEAKLDDLRSEDMVMKYVGDQAAYYDSLIESLAWAGRIEQSFEAAERARARAFLRLLGNRRIKPPTGERFDVVRQAEELRRKIEDWDRSPQPGTTLADLRRQYEALQPRVQVVAGEYASLTSVPALPIDAVRNELPEDTTLLSYFVTPFGVHAWILDKETLGHVRLRVSEAAIRRISCWTFELARPRGVTRPDRNGCSAGSANASEAYAALIEPLRNRIRKKRLMIVPHGELHYVPFAALYDEKSQRYLVEDYPITYVPSASTIRFLRDKDSAVGGEALVLGDPVKANLPGASREALQVAGKLHTTAKLGEEAQESLLYQLNGKVDLLHIAAHGTYDAANPLFSAIHLAGGNGRNGQLSVDEIQSGFDLSGVNLVVLSACQSGVGKRSGGDEIIGLTRSILYAGSPGVIATLWNISDAATPLLIETFYDHLLAGATAADALRAAQRDMLRHPNLADPRYWAAFFLTGDPQGRWSTRQASGQ